MDKQMIEEMAKDIAKRDCSLWENCPKKPKHNCVSQDHEIMLESTENYITIATWLVNAGYRKIPEGAVVIDKNENPCLSCPVPEDIQQSVDCSTICGAVVFGIDWQNQCRVLVKENKQLKKELFEERKETAEKFAERFKELVADRNCNEDYDWEDVQVDGQIFIECIDEICKEITEGKGNENG